MSTQRETSRSLDRALDRRPSLPVLPPLDEITATPLCALSLRRLIGTYTGYAIRVREGSEAEVNVGFDSNGVVGLDSPTSVAGTTLGDYADGNDVFVTKWYNQAASGGTYDANQATTAHQPMLLSSGALIEHGVYFEGTNDHFDTSWQPATSNDHTIMLVCQLRNVSTSDFAFFSVLDDWNDGIELRMNVYGNFVHAYNSTDLTTSGVTVTDTNVAIASMEDSLASNEQQFMLNGVLETSGSASGSISLGMYETVEIGTRNGGSYPIPGSLQELVYFDSKVTAAEQTILSDNATDHFGI